MRPALDLVCAVPLQGRTLGICLHGTPLRCTGMTVPAVRQKDEIKTFIETEFGYDLSRTCDEIRPHYHHVESCQETVPEAITAFLEGTDFEDVIRTAVSLGGDCDTLTCIAGGIAEAFYGIDSHLKQECESRLPEDMLAVLKRFNRTVHK